MNTSTDDPLAAAREAVVRLEWERGLQLFEEANASVELGPEDLEASGRRSVGVTSPA